MTLFLILAIIISLVSCGDDSKPNPDPAVGDGTPYSDFIEVMEIIRGYGDQVSELYLPYQSEYYYALAGAGTSSLRYAVENVLWLKGEGEDLASFCAESRYAGWDTIAEIGYASPYPYYFEGLILHIQGKTEEAVEPYANASIMTLYPEEGLDFYYLKDLEVKQLYELREQLRELEDQIYSAYAPDITGYTRDYRNFDSAYLRDMSEAAGASGDYAAALIHAKIALRNDPFDVLNWRSITVCALFAEDIEALGEYVQEGLTVFPEDENLKAFEQMILDAAKEVEG